MNKLFRRLWEHILDVLFPTRCVICRSILSPGKPRICMKCQEKLPLTQNGGQQKGNYFSKCISAVYYENDVRQSILRYKFSGVSAYAHAFGELTASCIYENMDEEYDFISWVPLAPDRKRKRGYDQTYLLAAQTAKMLCRPLEKTLRKKRGIKPQSKTGSPERRRANISGAYRVTEPALIAGKRILLIDDIVTSGSTLSECAKTLLMAGAEEVLCATLARTR